MNRGLVARLLAGFVAVALASEILARFVLGAADVPVLEWQDFTTQHKAAQLDQRGSVEVVIAGTSMAQQALVPSVLEPRSGRSVYNAALNGGVPTVMEPWLLEHVEPRVDGKQAIVWGLSALDLSASYGAAVEEAFASAKRTRSGTLASVDRWVSSWSELVRARTVLRDPSELFGDPAAEARASADEAEAQVGPDGERLAFETDRSEARRREVAERLTPFLIDRDDLAAVARVAHHARQQGVPLVLVELPVPERFKALYPRGSEQHALVAETLDALGDELGVAVFHPETRFDEDDFVDFTHLDADAAERFSTEVAGWLGTELARR